MRGTVAELSVLGEMVGDDFLRVWVREPARAGLREEVTALLPNALEVRIDPEFAAPARRRAAVAGAGTHPGRAVRRVPRQPGAWPIRGWRSCSARLHERVDRLMRPVLLEMAGFGSFREPTTVDFAGRGLLRAGRADRRRASPR